MKLMRTATAILAAATMALIPTASAQAALPQPEIAWVKDKIMVTGANPDEARILAKYRCYGGEEGTHLWASVKQGGEDLEEEGSGAWARSWYDTNYQYAEDPAGQTINCDGKWRTTHFIVKLVEGKELLRDGRAWMQFCVFDSQGGFGYEYGWVTVKVPGKA